MTVPAAPTDSFTHTFANVGDTRCRPANFVNELTSIVVCDVFRATIVNVPDAPATPQVPSAVDPFTELTNPNAFTARGPAPAGPTPARQKPRANATSATTRDIRNTDPPPIRLASTKPTPEYSFNGPEKKHHFTRLAPGLYRAADE
jgi:hypothetical protein